MSGGVDGGGGGGVNGGVHGVVNGEEYDRAGRDGVDDVDTSEDEQPERVDLLQ